MLNPRNLFQLTFRSSSLTGASYMGVPIDNGWQHLMYTYSIIQDWGAGNNWICKNKLREQSQQSINVLELQAIYLIQIMLWLYSWDPACFTSLKFTDQYPPRGHSQYILVGVCRGTSKKGGLRHGHNSKKGGPRHGHNPKKGVFGTGMSRKRVILGTGTMGKREFLRTGLVKKTIPSN